MKIRMLVVFVLVLASFGTPMQATDVATSIEILPLGAGLDRVMLTPDYFTRVGDVSFYGFVEYSGEAGGWYTNHSATWLPGGSWIGLRAEVGLDDAGNSGSALGVTFAPKLPGFVYFKATPQAVFGNYARTFEVNTSWKTKSLPLFGGELWSEGFIRAFRNSGNSYGQPQLWWKKSADSTWYFGTEVEVAGSSRTVRFGARKVF